MSKKGVVNIHGKEYKTVALRISEFREQCAASDGWGVSTQILEINDEKVVVQAFIMKTIEGFGYLTVGSGLAEERRDASKINRTSALENAETSALGRALSSLGLAGEEYCSADELLNALEQQDTWPPPEQSKAPPEVSTAPMPDIPEEEIPGDIEQLVQDNCERGSRLLGESAYRKWHNRILNNFWGVDSLTALEDKAAYAYFYSLQEERLAAEEKE